MKKDKIIRVLKEIGYIALQFFFPRIFLFNHISPVGLSFAFIKLFFDGNIFIVTGTYFISKIFLFFDFFELVIVAYEIVFLTLYYFTREFLKTKKQLLLVFVFLILSNSLRLYFEMFLLEDLIYFCVNIFLECLILFYFFKLFKVYKNKFIFSKFSRLDYFMFSLSVLFLSIGIFSYKIILLFFGFLIINTLLMIVCKMVPI